MDYVKRQFDHIEQTRWDTTDIDDAARLLYTLWRIEWDTQHLAMLQYRLGKYKESHHNFGAYWGTRVATHILFPCIDDRITEARILPELRKDIAECDEMILGRYRK
jgi:hypothetical protein